MLEPLRRLQVLLHLPADHFRIYAEQPVLADAGHAVAVLSAESPLRPGSCTGDSRVPLYCRRTHAGKVWPPQGHIRASGIEKISLQ